MAWINPNDFYQRVLLNDLVSLRALRTATIGLAQARSRATGEKFDTEPDLNAIDEAIKATEKLLAMGAHHS